MKKQKVLIISIVVVFTFIYLCSTASADVTDIDADVVANVTFAGGYNDGWIDGIDVTWTATHSGYLYVFAYNNYFGGASSVNGLTGNISDNINIGTMDDTGTVGYSLKGWRVGYVYNGTEYTWGGNIYEPGATTCGATPVGVYQYINSVSYSGGYTGHIIGQTPGAYDPCGLDYIALPFLLIESSPPEATLSGYVTNNLGNSVTAATITLNNSGGSTTSNDTGYYEITSIESGTYTITATSPTNNDYSDTVTITADTEKNITMTRLSPLLTWTDAETTKNDVYLKWRRNIVVDNVRIYKDTETRLLTTVASGSYLSGLYSDRNLDCDKGYVYWLQPMDNDVAGPKYRIDAKTDPCDGGGGDGGDPTPTPSPTATPGPTPPPWTNITPEEWLNLTLDQKQEILANMSLFPPLLEFQWEDIYVWGIHLFLILCGAVALDSITIQKVSEYTGLWAILPGVMFAYLTGYLVI